MTIYNFISFWHKGDKIDADVVATPYINLDDAIKALEKTLEENKEFLMDELEFDPSEIAVEDICTTPIKRRVLLTANFADEIWEGKIRAYNI